MSWPAMEAPEAGACGFAAVPAAGFAADGWDALGGATGGIFGAPSASVDDGTRTRPPKTDQTRPPVQTAPMIINAMNSPRIVSPPPSLGSWPIRYESAGGARWATPSAI